MSLSSLSLKRPVLATVMSILILLFGLLGFKFLGVREYPSIDPPVISVTTSYTRAAAEIIESQITEPLEMAINGIQGIRTLSSTSNQGTRAPSRSSSTSATTSRPVANDVRDKVAQAARLLPQDIDAPPVVTKAGREFRRHHPCSRCAAARGNIMQLDDYAEYTLLRDRLQTTR